MGCVMKETNLPLEEISISQIYLESSNPVTYQIPVYQRNYAWEFDEIKDLVKDVYDSLEKKSSVYYIGTLVTYKRDEGVFEVIDGQQRLTTIYLILRALDIEVRNKLTYTARAESAETLKKLPKFPEQYDAGIKNGFSFAISAINEIVGESRKQDFVRFFTNSVHIVHYRVPRDIDLNHYFEVMNSRGEQLEKHEIVKARLSEHLSNDDLNKFCRIWDACTEMNFYVQQKIAEKGIFGENLNDFICEKFEDLPNHDGNQGKASIESLLTGKVEKIKDNPDVDPNDRFQSIIDFPNFLLIVLKITRMEESGFKPTSFALDDKELIDEFDKVGNDAAFAKKIAFNLLKAKYLLDNYIVHHIKDNVESTTENPWKLQYFYSERNGKSNKLQQHPKNLTDGVVQDELVHLLSMFEVTFTPKQRKNYLFYCLLHLFKDRNVENYLEFLRRLADKYFFDIYLNPEKLNENNNQPVANAFDGTIISERSLVVATESTERKFSSIYKNGSASIPLYVFNYTDYKIWKKYANELRGKKLKKGSGERNDFFDSLGCSDFELDAFDNFYFSRTRKSLEHYYPQAKAGEGKALSAEDINCFGNFAMIGADANSSGSNWNPKTKLDHYTDRKSDSISVASLKFKIMMQMCNDNDLKMRNGYLQRDLELEWNYDDIKNHQERIISIICAK